MYQKGCFPPRLNDVAPLLNFVVQSSKNNSDREVTTLGKALVKSTFKCHPPIFKTSLSNISSRYLE